jgi:hypothetical protein
MSASPGPSSRLRLQRNRSCGARVHRPSSGSESPSGPGTLAACVTPDQARVHTPVPVPVPVPDLSGDGDGASVPDLPGGGVAPPSPSPIC